VRIRDGARILGAGYVMVFWHQSGTNRHFISHTSRSKGIGDNAMVVKLLIEQAER
jgi:hypothetical protein